MRLGLLWFFVPLFVEIWSIIKMSEHIGGWATFILLVAGLFFGLQLMRAQGINAMIKANQAAQSAQSPLGPIAEGIVKAFAGVLLIIPGFFSDLIALLILLPFVRKGFAKYLSKKGQFQGFATGGFGKGGFGGTFGQGMFGQGASGQGPFGANGFGKPSANDNFAGGNVYEHDGSAKTNDKVSDKTTDKAIDGQIIEHKPDK